MATAPGMTDLTEEQTAWFEQNLGKRYVTVQQRPEIPSRAERRAALRRARKRSDGKPHGGV